MAMLSATRDIADAAAAAHSIETVTERDRQKLIFEERRATLMRKLQRDRALPEIQVADSGSFGSDSDEDAVARRAGVHALAPTPSRAHFIVPETPLAHAGKCESRSAFNETCATLPPPQRSATRASPPSSQAVLPDLSSMTRRELQSEAKAHGIRANQTSARLVELLTERSMLRAALSPSQPSDLEAEGGEEEGGKEAANEGSSSDGDGSDGGAHQWSWRASGATEEEAGAAEGGVIDALGSCGPLLGSLCTGSVTSDAIGDGSSGDEDDARDFNFLQDDGYEVDHGDEEEEDADEKKNPRRSARHSQTRLRSPLVAGANASFIGTPSQRSPPPKKVRSAAAASAQRRERASRRSSFAVRLDSDAENREPARDAASAGFGDSLGELSLSFDNY
jgi:hypothetical protein